MHGIAATGQERPSLGLKVLLRLLPWIGRHRWTVAASLTAFLVARLLEASVPLFMKQIIDTIDPANPSSQDMATGIGWPALAIVAVVLVRMGVVSFARISIRKVGIGVAFDLRGAFYERLQRQGMRFYARRSIGDMMTRAVSDIGLIRRMISMGTILVVVMVYATIVGFAAMFWLAPELAWLVAPPLPFVAVYAAWASRRMNLASTAVQTRLSTLTDRTQEAFGGIRTLQAMAREEAELERFSRENGRYAESFLDQARISSAMTAWMPSLAAVATLIVLGYGGHLVLEGSITKGTFVAFFAYVAMVVQPMRVAGFMVNMLQRAAVSTERVFEVLDTPDEIRDSLGTRITPSEGRKAIELEDVSLTWPGASRAAIDRVNLEIASGETLAIMGRIGAGKSTLLALIARLVEPDSGRVLVDGVPLPERPIRELRERVALVPQDAFLFAEEIRANLSYDDPERESAHILEAAEAAEFRSTVEALPDGLGTLVGERGVTLSGGQRQRATVTRGIIRSAPVLLLDDCFASVDTDTEEKILGNVIRSRARRGADARLTTLLVTHRISTAQRADRVLVLDDGHVVELGTHDALIAADGYYASMAREQARTPESSPEAAT